MKNAFVSQLGFIPKQLRCLLNQQHRGVQIAHGRAEAGQPHSALILVKEGVPTSLVERPEPPRMLLHRAHEISRSVQLLSYTAS